MKSRIKKYGKCLWLEIDGKHDNTSWAITEEEIEPIRNACNAWLEHRSQEIMKESMEE